MVEHLGIDPCRIRGQLFIYPDLNKTKVMDVWSRKTSIPLGQFQKVIMLKSKVSKFKPNPLETFKLRFSSKEKFLKLQSIIDEVWKSAGLDMT